LLKKGNHTMNIITNRRENCKGEGEHFRGKRGILSG